MSRKLSDPAIASQVIARPVEWAWRQHLPKGTICVIAGRPDVGKGLATCRVAADMTNTPTKTQDGQNVLFSAAEDSDETMTKPRLEAAGADTDRILFAGFRLPADWKEFQQVVIENSIALVVMDPMASHLSGGISRHSDNIRVVTDPLAEFCEATGLLVLIVEHALKRVSKYADPISMISGSGSGLSAAARAAYIFGKDPNDPDRRLMCPAKLNVAEWPKTLAFVTDVEAIDVKYDTGRKVTKEIPFLLFEEESHEHASMLLDQGKGTKNQKPGRPPDKRAKADEWLAQYLFDAGKPVKATAIFEDVTQLGRFSKSTIKRAAKDMGVVKKGKGQQNLTWELPPRVTKMVKAAKAAGVKP